MVTADDETRGEVTEDSNHKEETIEEGEGDQGGQVHLGAPWGRDTVRLSRVSLGHLIWIPPSTLDKHNQTQRSERLKNEKIFCRTRHRCEDDFDHFYFLP